MKLKEMDNTGVLINTKDELEEFLSICTSAKWEGKTTRKGFREYSKYGFYVEANRKMCYGHVSSTGQGMKLITLAEFKKEQGIMKYKEGDMLEDITGNLRRTIQGNIGVVYISTDEDGDARLDAESEFDDMGFQIKTETTKTDMTVSQLEKKCGLPAGSLNVVAE